MSNKIVIGGLVTIGFPDNSDARPSKPPLSDPTREIVNGSYEPIWRRNARRDADRFKLELVSAPLSRRQLLASAGSALMLEYVAQRRAVAFPLMRGSGGASPPVGVTGITIQRTGTEYPYLPDALFAMQSGDTILLPAGKTYQYQGETRYYASHYTTDNRSTLHVTGSGYQIMYLGADPQYGGMLSADNGSIEAVGSQNNGRALITPPYGILAQDFLPTDTEMYFDPSTPATNFPSMDIPQYPYLAFLYLLPALNEGQFEYVTLAYTGIDAINNGLVGITGDRGGATIPAGSIVTSYLANQNKALFVTTGQNPGWTFTNLELAYAQYGSYHQIVNSIWQMDSRPGGPYVGSMTLNNCFIHDCKQGFGLGSSGIGDSPIYTRAFDTEIARGGAVADEGQTHNIYIGHIGELLMDNCYSHETFGAWCVKSRAALTILTSCQIRGERTNANTDGNNNSGCDFSEGGIAYLIGNVHQCSLKGANTLIDWNAETGPGFGAMEGGGANQHQELYVINCNMIGPADGVGKNNSASGPLRVYNLGVCAPQFTKLSKSSGGSLAARRYFIAMTNVGTAGGESTSSMLSGNVGTASISVAAPIYEFLDVADNNLITVTSVLETTGANAWNCYANYGDPLIQFPGLLTSPPTTPTPGDISNLWWDVGHTHAIFSTTSGATVVSLTGTVTNGSNVINSISGFSGLASLPQLLAMTIYVNGANQHLYVTSTDEVAGTVTMSGSYSGTTGSATITFGCYLWCGFTYQTALGDSINLALTNGYGLNSSLACWWDGSYTAQSDACLLGVSIQLDPGQKLVVNAPETGPSWATGINFWAVNVAFIDWGGIRGLGVGDGLLFGMSKQNASPIAFGGSWTSPASILKKAAQLTNGLFLQNATPLPQGTDFTEPTTGLTNNNPTRNKLKWYRRAAMLANGPTMDCWYAVVPPGGLSGYSETMYLTYSTLVNGAVTVWRGCSAKIFDDSFLNPVSWPALPVTVNTAAGNVSVLANFWSSTGATAGPGFTQIAHAWALNAEYKSSASSLTSLSITETGGLSSDNVIVDALVGDSAPPTLISTVTIGETAQVINFTIPSATQGDVIYLMLGSNNYLAVRAIGQVGTPIIGTATAGSPVIHFQNCIFANFNQTVTDGISGMGDGYTAVPGGHVTTTSCLVANPYNGSSFGAPLWSAVFADSDQSHFDYRLAPGSPALASASNPGTSPRGQDLVPHYQVSWHGTPTGTPIPAKAARSDVGPGKTGAIGALSA